MRSWSSITKLTDPYKEIFIDMLRGMKKEAKRMTFINGIRKLIKAEGYNLGEYEEDAKTMDGNLIYVVRFCKSSSIQMNYDMAKGVLIAAWSLVAEGVFNDDEAAGELIDQILKACEG